MLARFHVQFIMLATPSLLVNLHTYFGAREFVHARTQRCNGQLQAGLGFRGTGGAMEAEHALPPEEQATIDKSGAHCTSQRSGWQRAC